MAVHELIDLDFAPGIKAEHINYNFDVIYNWMKRERLRVGGWGIVEGFQLSCDARNFTVTVGDGVIINKSGEEISVPSKTFGAGEVDYRTVTRKYRVDTEGKITLDDYPYDSRNRKYITYNPPNTTYVIDESMLYITDEDDFYVPIVRVIGKDIWINATDYKNTTVSVTQRVASDRVDTIMLHMNGEYEYLWSIDSPSPSHVDIGDFEDSLCVGVVYWTITTEGVNCDFFINHRSYRRVYVDENNVLYLNGEVYQKPKYIYFEEPAEGDREINDLWYNVKDNTLYIWRYRDGELGWVIVNDHSEIVIQERRVWYPEDDDYPTDLKTFKFSNEEVNLHFVPGSNALSIIVDNAPLMSDQYIELQANEQEISEMTDTIKDLQLKLEQRKVEYDNLESQRKNLEGTIHVLKKDIRDSYTLYSYMYDEGTDTIKSDYKLQQEDVPNLQNVMIINRKVSAALDELANLLSKMDSVKSLMESYEEQIEMLKSITDGTYVSTGNGFRLKEPLSHAAFVEVTVTHVVRMKPVRETFQRAAIFIKEGDITVPSNNTQLFFTDAAYSVGDDQLEVFVDGIRLSKGNQQFFEVVDELTDKEKAAAGSDTIDYHYNNEEHLMNYRDRSSRTFRVATDLRVGQTVSYRISKHVWSYDQLDKLISNIREYAQTALENANKALAAVTDIEENVNAKLDAMRDSLAIIQQEIKKIDLCYKRGETIAWKDMPKDVKDNMIGQPLHQVKALTTSFLTFEGIRVETGEDAEGNKIITGGDIFELYYVSPDLNRVLIGEGKIPDKSLVDYDYNSSADGTDLEIEILREDLVGNGAYVYLSGFKRGRES